MDAAFMIWPVFVDVDGRPLADGTRVNTDKPVNARMLIVNEELRVSEHRYRIKEGLDFYLREGWKIVAEGVVTRIVDLAKD